MASGEKHFVPPSSWILRISSVLALLLLFPSQPPEEFGLSNAREVLLPRDRVSGPGLRGRHMQARATSKNFSIRGQDENAALRVELTSKFKHRMTTRQREKGPKLSASASANSV